MAKATSKPFLVLALNKKEAEFLYALVSSTNGVHNDGAAYNIYSAIHDAFDGKRSKKFYRGDSSVSEIIRIHDLNLR